MAEISLLLGAGFSVNKGYPTANQLNKKLLGLDPEDFCVFTDGQVFFKKREQKDSCWYTPDFKHKYFVVKFMHYYSEKNGGFNYEDFYDFYSELSKGKDDADFFEFCQKFREEFHSATDDINLLSRLNKIFNQLILLFLVDREGKMFYEPVHYSKPYYEGYTGFLNCVESLGQHDIVHIHTLNHDIFFETLSSSDWLQGQLSDGFQEMGSPYYGGLKGSYKMRLSFFNNLYTQNFRLYKLHGSMDYFPFHLQNTGIDTYVKIKMGIGTTELYKEIQNESGEFTISMTG